MKYTDNSRFPFGMHKDKPFKDVPANYLLWLLDQDWARESWPHVVDYIRENQECLEKEEDGVL